MKYPVLALLAMMLSMGAQSSCIKNEPNWLWNYDGSLGEKHRVRVTLVFAGEEVSGLYFYASQLKDIPLKGKVRDGTDILLDELDPAGNVVARFQGKFLERDPRGRFGNGKLECEAIVGSWRKLDSADELPLDLSLESGTAGSLANRYAPAGADDDALIHRNAYRFRDAVRRGDKTAVAAAVAYPIRIGLPGGRKLLRSPAELVANYDAIFSLKYRAAISNALPRNMFVRDQGIMLGSGEVWFGSDGKVTALNRY
jgi:hypothetical protein